MSTEKDKPKLRSVFECASQNLRASLQYMHRDLKMPRDVLRMQVEGILTSFAVEDAFHEGQKARWSDES